MDEEIRNAKAAINKGGIVIYPTETAYGVAADARNEKAVEKVFRAKKRPKDKGLTVIVNSLEQAKKHADLSKNEEKVIKRFMPGPLTLVSSKKDSSDLAENLNEDFVFRISSKDIARRIANETPITATSANISGEKTSYSIEDISDKLKNDADYIINEGVLEPQPTSTIAEVLNGKIKIHREGPITKKELEQVL